jgi:hypothetical protein
VYSPRSHAWSVLSTVRCAWRPEISGSECLTATPSLLFAPAQLLLHWHLALLEYASFFIFSFTADARAATASHICASLRRLWPRPWQRVACVFIKLPFLNKTRAAVAPAKKLSAEFVGGGRPAGWGGTTATRLAAYFCAFWLWEVKMKGAEGDALEPRQRCKRKWRWQTNHMQYGFWSSGYAALKGLLLPSHPTRPSRHPSAPR